MTLVKICGITNIEDARVAVAAGTDMVGFNFYRRSSRFIEPEQARSIIESLKSEVSRDVMMVGVFVDEAPESLAQIAATSGIEAVQLHGDESIEFCSTLKELMPESFVIKVIHVGDDGSDRPTKYEVDAIMLDAFDENLRGGTGRTIDWNFARRVRESVSRLILAGGLSPENVGAAINEVRPYAVDVCSALESAPGKKDAGKVKAFVEAAHNA
jgi:phosphoribosylanthranilate isomerase